jgi:DNA-binding MarR family transcriptional regulator
MADSATTELFLALGAVVKRLRHRPLPDHAALHGAPFAPRHIAALLQIGQEAPVGMSELAERMHVSLATMSQVVSDLESWGLVERASDAADRRRTLVSVAPEHRPTTRAILDRRLRPIQRALARLGPSDGAALLRGLTALAEELDDATTQPPAGKPAAATPDPKETTR